MSGRQSKRERQELERDREQQLRLGAKPWRMPNWLIGAEIVATMLVMFVGLPALAGGEESDKAWYEGLIPILLLLAAIAISMWRMKPAEEEQPGQLAHRDVPGFQTRRVMNWLVLGLTYAFLYWGRYNLADTIIALGGKEMYKDFNQVFAVGTAVYGLSFLLNGPLTDRLGGRFSILVGGIGAACANALMGYSIVRFSDGRLEYADLKTQLILLYGVNMYFQSFGAVAIVKANSAWFHVLERGVFGAIFGILISLGIYFAYDWTKLIVDGWQLPAYWGCFAPATALGLMFIIGLFVVRNRPSEAGYADINTGDASAGDEDANKKQEPASVAESVKAAVQVFKLMLKKQEVEVFSKGQKGGKVVTEWRSAMMRVVVLIAIIEFCSGFLRQAIMQQSRGFAKSMGLMKHFVYDNWGMVLCCAGILGGVFAGVISDKVFKSRRGPVVSLLYIGMLIGAVVCCFILDNPSISWAMAFMSLCVIGVHGMLSGTASMDFGGTKNVGIAVGIIDGFVYFGSSLQSWVYGYTLPKGDNPLAKDPNSWYAWPIFMVGFALVGLVFSFYIRNVRPKPKSKKKA